MTIHYKTPGYRNISRSLKQMNRSVPGVKASSTTEYINSEVKSKARRRDVIKMKTSMYVQKEKNNFNMINYLKASGKYKDFKWRKKQFIKRKKKKQKADGEECSSYHSSKFSADSDASSSDASISKKSLNKSMKSSIKSKSRSVTPDKDKADEPDIRSQQDDLEKSGTIKGISKHENTGFFYQYEFVHK